MQLSEGENRAFEEIRRKNPDLNLACPAYSIVPLHIVLDTDIFSLADLEEAVGLQYGDGQDPNDYELAMGFLDFVRNTPDPNACLADLKRERLFGVYVIYLESPYPNPDEIDMGRM